MLVGVGRRGERYVVTGKKGKDVLADEVGGPPLLSAGPGSVHVSVRPSAE